MELRVRLFARARDLAGSDFVTVTLQDGARVDDLRTALQTQVTPLASMTDKLHVAIGTEYASNDTVLQPTDSITCFPPVSGG